MNDKTATVSALLLLILLIWLYTSGRLAAMGEVLGGRKTL